MFISGTEEEKQDAINLIKEAGGIPVWAHPYISYCNGKGIMLTNEEIEKVLNDLKIFGLEGIEAQYILFNCDQKNFLSNLAEKNNLFVSAGGDFHGYKGRDSFICCENSLIISRRSIFYSPPAPKGGENRRSRIQAHASACQTSIEARSFRRSAHFLSESREDPRRMHASREGPQEHRSFCSPYCRSCRGAFASKACKILR